MKKVLIVTSFIVVGTFILGTTLIKSEKNLISEAPIAQAQVTAERTVAYTYTTEASLAFEPTFANFEHYADAMLQVKIVSIGEAKLFPNGNVYTAYTANVEQVLAGEVTTDVITLYVDGGYLSIADYIAQAQQLQPESLAKSGLQAVPAAKQQDYIHFTSDTETTLSLDQTYVVAANALTEASEYFVPSFGYGIFQATTETTYTNAATAEVITVDQD